MAAGNLEVACITLSSASPAVKSGKARYLASTGAKRNVALPDLPTFAEAGFPEFDVTRWVGLFGPAGVPQEIIAKINTAVAFALADPAVRERLMAVGFDPAPTTPRQFAQLLTIGEPEK